mmetsp:Transcript_115045/g.330520  ORF Transcript_115045/g.330520 Transcript_115045/m.330520 type:complete len:349 (-) Transcript_115045:158-1204(-)
MPRLQLAEALWLCQRLRGLDVPRHGLVPHLARDPRPRAPQREDDVHDGGDRLVHHDLGHVRLPRRSLLRPRCVHLASLRRHRGRRGGRGSAQGCIEPQAPHAVGIHEPRLLLCACAPHGRQQGVGDVTGRASLDRGKPRLWAHVPAWLARRHCGRPWPRLRRPQPWRGPWPRPHPCGGAPPWPRPWRPRPLPRPGGGRWLDLGGGVASALALVPCHLRGRRRRHSGNSGDGLDVAGRHRGARLGGGVRHREPADARAASQRQGVHLDRDLLVRLALGRCHRLGRRGRQHGLVGTTRVFVECLRRGRALVRGHGGGHPRGVLRLQGRLEEVHVAPRRRWHDLGVVALSL